MYPPCIMYEIVCHIRSDSNIIVPETTGLIPPRIRPHSTVSRVAATVLQRVRVQALLR